MKKLNAFFTPAQLAGVITIITVIAVVAYLWIAKDFSSFANHIQ